MKLFSKKRKILPVLEKEFYHDGRGPELQRVRWSKNGTVLVGFEYFNPDDSYDSVNLKNIKLIDVEAYLQASEEVHGQIHYLMNSQAAIFEITDSEWIKTFNQRHLASCKHFQVMFYDEIFDVICKEITPGKGKL